MKATGVSAPLVQAIEFAWSEIQSNNDLVPDVVVTLGSGIVRQGLKLGHFAANVWTHGNDDSIHELFVGAEGLNRGAKSLMGTLLHEAAHAWAEANKIQDTSRQGRYHNNKFRMIAETFGLKLVHDDSLGWSGTELPDETAAVYEDAILALDLALTAYRKGPKMVQLPTGTTPVPVSPTGRTSNNNGLSARCGCGRRIRVSQTVLEMGAIVCGNCGQPFTA